MANDLSQIIPLIFAQGMMALRETCVMPRVVNTSYSTDAARKGDTVRVPLPSPVPATDIVPANISPDPGDLAPPAALIPMKHWKEAPFQLSDKDIADAVADVVPMQVSESIKAIAAAVDSQILGNDPSDPSGYMQIGGSHGTAGTTPFATDAGDATQCAKILNVQLAPMRDRRFVLDPEAQANALNIRAFQDYSWSNAVDVIQGGDISQQRLGFDWFMDQLIPLHTSGNRTGATVAGAEVVGAATITVSGGTGSINPGDVFQIAGDSTYYSVSVDATNVWTIHPTLKVATSGGEAITFVNASATDSPQSLAIHRDCIGFASRLLLDEDSGLGNRQSAVDPVSGLALTLEVKREHYRTRWAFSLLWGSQVVRPELGCRLWG